MKTFRKVLAVILTVIMSIPTISVYANEASIYDDRSFQITASSISESLTDQIGLEYLLRGFNVLSEVELKTTNLNRPDIIRTESKAALRDLYTADDDGFYDAKTYLGRSMVDWAVSAGLNMSFSTSAEVDLGKLFKASASSKFGMNVNASYKKSYDSLFSNMTLKYTHNKNYIKNPNSTATRNAIRSALHPDFLRVLTTAPNDEINAKIFKVYGTHFLTSYGRGGWVENTISTINTKTEIDKSIKTQYEVAVGGGALGSIAEIKSGIGMGMEAEVTYKKGDDVTTATTHGCGGGIGGMSFTTDDIKNTDVAREWKGSFDNPGVTHCIMMDNNLELTGIWELLPDTYPVVGYDPVKRYEELIYEYIKLSMEQDVKFFNEFLYKAIQETGSYNNSAIYENSLPPADKYIRIANKNDFAKIGSDPAFPLNGEYILMNNLDLNNSAIGLRGKTFTGTFDGNGYTISNYSDGESSTGSQEMVAGLFPINSGTIKNLTVENTKILYGENYFVTKTPNDDTKYDYLAYSVRNRAYYVGVISGINYGTIENCRVKSSKAEVTLYTKGENNRALVHSGGITGYNSGTIRKSSFVYDDNTEGVLAKSVMYNATNYNATLRNVNVAYAGGITGVNTGTVADCYSKAKINARALSYDINTDIGSRYKNGDHTPYLDIVSGGIVGYNTARVERSFSDCTAANVTLYSEAKYRGANGKTYDSKKTRVAQYYGILIGANDGTLTDCFYLTTGNGYQAIGGGTNSKPQGAIITVSFNDLCSQSNWKNKFEPEGWICGINAKPVLSAIPHTTANSSAFVISYTNNIPDLYVGDAFDDLLKLPEELSKDLSKFMTIKFTDSMYAKQLKDITDDNNLRKYYNFSSDGDRTVQLLYSDGNDRYIGSFTLTVREKPFPTTSVRLNKRAALIKKDEAEILIATVYPSMATNKEVIWTSSNYSIVDVDRYGKVYALKQGAATITATTAAGGFFDTCEVTVPPKASIELNPAGSKVFDSAAVGYSARSPYSVTIKNTSSSATGDLAIMLLDENDEPSDYFVRSVEKIEGGLPGGASASFTVAPKTGLAAGTYTAYVVVRDISDEEITQMFSVSFTVNPAPTTYGISLNPSGNKTFDAATVGYGTQTAHSVTVNNTGNQATGNLTVALSGTNAGSFTLSATSISSIAVGGNSSFTVRPNTGLAAGTYTATVTVSGGANIASQSFTVIFTVNPATTYAISALPSSIGFGTVQIPYTQPDAQTVTITNTGTGAVTLNAPVSSAGAGTNYTISGLSTTTLAANGSTATFTVRPKTGLQSGTYNETITITGSNNTSATVSVSFTVAPSNARLTGIPALSFNVSGGQPVFVDAAIFGIEDNGNGNLSVTLRGDKSSLSLYGVRFAVSNVPANAAVTLTLEKNGVVTSQNISGSGGVYTGGSTAPVTYNHGESGIYRVYVGGAIAGSFTFNYVNETIPLSVRQEYIAGTGSWYFAPIDILGAGYRYEIISRPNTLGGKAPWINAYGQFSFEAQVMPMSISRAGEYIVRVTDNSGNVVTVYKITVN